MISETVFHRRKCHLLETIRSASKSIFNSDNINRILTWELWRPSHTHWERLYCATWVLNQAGKSLRDFLFPRCDLSFCECWCGLARKTERICWNTNGITPPRSISVVIHPLAMNSDPNVLSNNHCMLHCEYLCGPSFRRNGLYTWRQHE